MERDKPTDMELALYWAIHIDQPCSVEVDGKTENIRSFYLRGSKENILPILTNPFAKRFLEMKIREYS